MLKLPAQLLVEHDTSAFTPWCIIPSACKEVVASDPSSSALFFVIYMLQIPTQQM
jgi:hypothetical protein